MRMHATGHLGLASSVFVALVVAACGGGEGPGPQVPGGPAPGESAAPSPTAPASAVPTAPATSGSAQAGVTPPPAAPMKAIGPSAFAEDLKKLGIDPQKPQPLNKLSPDVIRKLMPTFAKSLGVKCEFCHDKNNFKAPTPHKRVAAKMWDEYVVKLSLDDGGAAGAATGALYCDSCHGGKSEFLDRHDKKALSAWMDANYVSKLKRADKKDHGCETCHGDPFEPDILQSWHGAK
jgi:hypothetical protein